MFSQWANTQIPSKLNLEKFNPTNELNITHKNYYFILFLQKIKYKNPFESNGVCWESIAICVSDSGMKS